MRDFERLMVGGIVAKARVVLKGMFSRDRRFRLLRAAGAKRPDNPLEIQYWSTTPYQLGGAAMKFSLRPQLHSLPTRPEKSADKLRRAMAASLRDRDAAFDFLVQLQTDAQSMPIEDATRRWDEHVSPFVKAATLKIRAQAFESAAQLEFGEQLSFNPWHGIHDHRPLGGINRARKHLYEVMSSRRLDLNGSLSREPTIYEVLALFMRATPCARCSPEVVARGAVPLSRSGRLTLGNERRGAGTAAKRVLHTIPTRNQASQLRTRILPLGRFRRREPLLRRDPYPAITLAHVRRP